MTIEKLEALERAATAGPFAHDVDRRHGGADQIIELSSGRHLTIVFGTSNGNENDLPLLVEARNALPSLLAVAKAAKKMRSYQDGGDDYGGMGPALNNQVECAKELDAALAQLEATP